MDCTTLECTAGGLKNLFAIMPIHDDALIKIQAVVFDVVLLKQRFARGAVREVDDQLDLDEHGWIGECRVRRVVTRARTCQLPITCRPAHCKGV